MTKQFFSYLLTRVVNSWIWFHVYYKHTKEYKKEVKDATERVVKIKEKALKRRRQNEKPNGKI
jgi:hypothetical protein